MTTNSDIAVIVAAAGSSSRMGGGIKKEYLPLDRGTVLSGAVKIFLKSLYPEYRICALVVTVPPAGQDGARRALECDEEFMSLSEKTGIRAEFVEGGGTRQDSVRNALEFIAEKGMTPELVAVHDGARPFVSAQTVLLTVDTAAGTGAAVPGVTPVDTQKQTDENGFISAHLERSRLSAVQTPQVFGFRRFLDAHRKCAGDGCQYTDDTEIWGKYCGSVKVVKGDEANIKLTFAGDYRKKSGADMEEIRTGIGYDIHRLVPGRRLVLGGIDFAYEKGEDGHSDGDALFHAVTDAVLGAAGLGDIGSFFPPEDMKWKDADSAGLLRSVMEKIREAGWRVGNIDCVIKLEKPKFLPYRDKVIKSVADALGTEEHRVFVKAKTGEKMGPVGTGDAVEATAVCLLVR